MNSRVTLIAVAVLGTVILHRLAHHVEGKSLTPQMKLAVIDKSEILVVYAPAKLIEFAASHGPFQNNDELARSLRAANLNGFWFGYDIRYLMNNGVREFSTRVVRPGADRLHFEAASAVLATLAGRPPKLEFDDYRPAKIVVIDEALMTLNPIEAIKDFKEICLVKAPFIHSEERQIGLEAMVLGRDD